MKVFIAILGLLSFIVVAQQNCSPGTMPVNGQCCPNANVVTIKTITGQKQICCDTTQNTIINGICCSLSRVLDNTTCCPIMAIPTLNATGNQVCCSMAQYNAVKKICCNGDQIATSDGKCCNLAQYNHHMMECCPDNTVALHCGGCCPENRVNGHMCCPENTVSSGGNCV